MSNSQTKPFKSHDFLIPVEEIARRMIIADNTNASFALEGFTPLPYVLELQQKWVYGEIEIDQYVKLTEEFINNELAEYDEMQKIFDLEGKPAENHCN